MEQEELKPCPNPECGSADVEVIWTGSYYCPNSGLRFHGMRFVRCECGVSGPETENDAEQPHLSRIEAARLWNLLPRMAPVVSQT